MLLVLDLKQPVEPKLLPVRKEVILILRKLWGLLLYLGLEEMEMAAAIPVAAAAAAVGMVEAAVPAILNLVVEEEPVQVHPPGVFQRQFLDLQLEQLEAGVVHVEVRVAGSGPKDLRLVHTL